MPIFKFCAVCDDVRLEVQNKASLIGFYGMLPYVEISVQNPTLPIAKLTFLLISGEPVPAGKYRLHLSLKDPQGRELLPQVDSVSQDVTAAPYNAALGVQPMPLRGAGKYRIAAIVNDKEDSVWNFVIKHDPLLH